MDPADSDDCYSNDEEYFLDICRAGELEELKEFITGLKQGQFDYMCLTNSLDNFLHLVAANNLVEVFEYLYPIVQEKYSREKMGNIINRQNSTGNTPLHYAVITDSKEMALKLLGIGADTGIVNEFQRTPFDEAEQFDKLQLAQILAPVTKHDLDTLKKEMANLDVCNEQEEDDSDNEDTPDQSNLHKGNYQKAADS